METLRVTQLSMFLIIPIFVHIVKMYWKIGQQQAQRPSLTGTSSLAMNWQNHKLNFEMLSDTEFCNVPTDTLNYTGLFFTFGIFNRMNIFFGLSGDIASFLCFYLPFLQGASFWGASCLLYFVLLLFLDESLCPAVPFLTEARTKPVTLWQSGSNLFYFIGNIYMNGDWY